MAGPELKKPQQSELIKDQQDRIGNQFNGIAIAAGSTRMTLMTLDHRTLL